MTGIARFVRLRRSIDPDGLVRCPRSRRGLRTQWIEARRIAVHGAEGRSRRGARCACNTMCSICCIGAQGLIRYRGGPKRTANQAVRLPLGWQPEIEHRQREVLPGRREGQRILLSISPDGGAPPNRTVRTILEAGLLCLARLGHDRTSIQAIADTAGLNRTTVYRYFGDRNRLFNAINDYMRDKQRAEVAARIPVDARLDEALAAIGEMLASTVLAFDIPGHLRRHDRGMGQFFGLYSQDRHERISSLIRPYIARAFQAGELPPDLPEAEAVEWAALVLMGIETLPDSISLDLRDPGTVGRTFAHRICQGISQPSFWRPKPAPDLTSRSP